MAQMERNVNLEEIDSDALFGIDALKGQSIGQKIIFFGTLGAGVVANVALPMLLDTPRVVCVFIFLGLLLIGIAFGCNYTQDLTYGKYMYCYFFKPRKILTYKSTEDIEYIRKKAKELEAEEDLIIRREKGRDPKAQRKLLVKLILFVVVLISVIVGALVYSLAIKEPEYHHEALIETDWRNEA